MKLNIETLQDTFKFGYEQFEDSRKESNLVMDLYHNRQYNAEQLEILRRRGQPAETFNVIKTFSRLLLGYYSTIVNTVKIVPKKQSDIITAGVLNDIVDYVFKQNNFIAEAEKIKLDLLLNGIMCAYVDVEELQETDEFNRPKFKINMQHVPIYELVLDPLSMRDDYADARFIHRFKWVSEETIVKIFGKDKLKELHEYENTLNQQDTEFDKYFRDRFVGYHNVYNAYLLVHSIMVDDDNKIWSVYWAGDTILDKSEITYREVKNPYRIYRLHNNNVKAEYYGIFRDIIETQNSMNQALIKLQLLANAQKVFVQESSIDNLKEFTDAVNRVNAVIPVKDLAGVKVENLSQDVLEQYKIIDAALMRIQRILSVNDSFLGMAYASDSGSKVEIQQRASITALRYLTLAIEQFYRLLGWDIVCLIKQYFTFHDVMRIADQSNSVRWIEINKPMMTPDGPVMEIARDPGSGQPMADPNGQIILSPMPTAETDIEFTDADIEVESVAYNDEIDKNRLMIEQFISGPLGQMLSQANPAGFFQVGALALKETKTKYSMEIASILEQTAMGMSMMQQQAMATGNAVGQERPKSTSNETSGK